MSRASGKGLTALVLITMLASGCLLVLNESDVSNAETEGQCGPSLYWSIDGSGHLSITGSGIMYKFTETSVRWGGNTVRTASLPDGLSNISDYAFADCTELTIINMPASVTEIGEWAFRNCNMMQTLTFTNDSVNIAPNAFYGCSKIYITNKEGYMYNLGHVQLTMDRSTGTPVPGIITITIEERDASPKSSNEPWAPMFIHKELDLSIDHPEAYNRILVGYMLIKNWDSPVPYTATFNGNPLETKGWSSSTDSDGVKWLDTFFDYQGSGTYKFVYLDDNPRNETTYMYAGIGIAAAGTVLAIIYLLLGRRETGGGGL